jgi:pimeloyl-ACP methyl ester carboxylesterase
MRHTRHVQACSLARAIGQVAMLLGLTVLLVQSATPGAAQNPLPPRCDWSDQSYTDFYTPPDLGVLTPERLGELLRIEHIRTYSPDEVANAAGMSSSPYGAEAYRILYLSQAPPGTPRAVSGFLIIPTGSAPAGGFPVLAHGHATSGTADICAPSKSDMGAQLLLDWVANGYIVSATDYVGLGTPGIHPYAVGEAEAFSMLDSARAALRFCDNSHGIVTPAANRIFLEGHSQGGHAALFAHQLWPSYAPELNVLGTVAFAPGSEPRLLVEQMVDPRSPLMGPGALALYAYSVYYGAPKDLGTWLQEPYATELPDKVEQQCVAGISLWLGSNPDQVFQPDMLAAVREQRWDDLQPWTGYMDINTPGNYTSLVPVLVLQGQRDDVVPPEANDQLTQRLCVHGTRTKLNLYPFATHITVTRLGQADALQWMADRLAGEPAPSSCPDFPFSVFLPFVSQ